MLPPKPWCPKNERTEAAENMDLGPLSNELWRGSIEIQTQNLKQEVIKLYNTQIKWLGNIKGKYFTYVLVLLMDVFPAAFWLL